LLEELREQNAKQNARRIERTNQGKRRLAELKEERPDDLTYFLERIVEHELGDSSDDTFFASGLRAE